MYPRERLLHTLTGRKADRVPICLSGFQLPSRERIEALEDPAWREIAERIFNETHYAVSCGSGVNRYLVTPPQSMREVRRQQSGDRLVLTHEIDTPKGKLTAVTARNEISDTTWTVKYPVESLQDVDRIRSVPWQRPPHVTPPDLSRRPEDFAQRGIVHTGVSSPFVCVAGMMPYDYFLELCATELPLLRELTAICLERILDVLEVVLSEGTVEYVWMGGCEWLTPPMGSPRLYDELVQEFERPVIERIHQGGALCHVHCHGRVRSTLEKVIERGADFFEPVEPPPDGDITFAEAKRLAAGRIALGGNIEDRLIANENVDTVEAACRAAFEGGKQHMVFETTAGPIRTLTPRMLANYHRLIDVWEELSTIPA